MKRTFACVLGVPGMSLAALGRAAAVAAPVAAGVWTATAPDSLGDRLVAILETSFERADLGDARGIAGIIALGGSEDRIREAGRLARRFPHLRVVVSGSGEEPNVRRLLGPGIEPGRLAVEKHARNTHENARFAAALLGPQPGERWLLVTSAAHMPRAVGAFRRSVVNVEPWPIHDRVPGAVRALSIARHEWLGLAVYWLLGRTNALLPAPMAADGAGKAVAATGGKEARGTTAPQAPAAELD